MFQNLTIRTKLIGGFIVVALIAGALGTFCIARLKTIAEADLFLFEKVTLPMESLARISEGFERAAANIAYCVYSRKTGDFLSIGDAALGEVVSNIDKYRQTFISIEDERLAEEMLVRWEAYRDYYGTLREYVVTGAFDEASAFFSADVAETRRACRKAIGNLVKYHTNYANIIADDNTLTAERTTVLIWFSIAAAVLCAVGIGFWIADTISAGLSGITSVADAIAGGNLKAPVDTGRRDEIGDLALSIEKMQSSLRESRGQEEAKNWLLTGIGRLNDTMRGDPDMEVLATKVISEIARQLDAQVGALYLMDGRNHSRLSLIGSYAYTKRKSLSNAYELGEGLVGQAALEKQQILVANVPEDYIRITSGLGERIPKSICVTPFIYEELVKGVVEIGTLGEMTDAQMTYLTTAMPNLAVAVESAERRTNLAEALSEAQRLSGELQAQQEELKTANEELEEQSQQLKISEERLKQQQEELQATNEELEEKNNLLERQKKEVEDARMEIEEKARELALASKYKSEFLANMSHELRSPLNSLLLLAQGLAGNKERNLTPNQVESAEIIHGSGSDLLNLIDEILDLSKIEAGRMDLHVETVKISDLIDGVRASFGPLAAQKKLSLDIPRTENAPDEIRTDRKRVQQIIRNLLSNAFKFTEQGGVTVAFGHATWRDGRWEDTGGEIVELRKIADAPPGNSDRLLSVMVKDTGIGIAPEHQKSIFEAFQQADGGTSRKYGGTGLGLSISRELAGLLGGEITLESKPGVGSTFTLYLPLTVEKTGALSVVEVENGNGSGTARQNGAPPQPEEHEMTGIPDDRDDITAGDQAILVIEDDPNFAGILHEKCRERGFKCITSPTGEAGLKLAKKHLPTAVLLDIRLPGIDGWTVLGALKDHILTRHIPVHIISAEQSSTESLRRGAIGHAEKPLDQESLEKIFQRIETVSSETPKAVLVVEDDPKMRRETAKLIGDGDVRVDEAKNAAEALSALRTKKYDCMVLDLGLPDMEGRELLACFDKEGISPPPVIVHTARDLTTDEERDLREHAGSIVIKDVRSQERLLDEVSLFLHRIVNRMPERKRKIIRDLHDTDELLKNKQVLIVDDDMRTTFAISRLLSDRGMKSRKAENGERALQILDNEPDIALVLMDIMMPVMDGYEAILQIRTRDEFQTLPIIALTAKAMPEDREKCLAAGANDYLPKPVDPERLISMIRVWLYR